MSGYGTETSLLADEEEEVRGWISIPFVIGAALACGAGLILLILWLVTFTWAFLSGVALLVLGMAMLMNRRAGLDRAPA
ncbi:MAG: hypothetical protein ACYDFT_00635 [Thermoplasmata archaeon]